MTTEEKQKRYSEVLRSITALIDGEDDAIAVMATVVCELHRAFDFFHWTGFYRHTMPAVLKVGPYQGSHGCLTIPFEKGVCGRAAREKKTQIVADVRATPYHIACSAETRSEIVVPVLDKKDNLCAVLDIDSNIPEVFDAVDREQLEKLADLLRDKFPCV